MVNASGETFPTTGRYEELTWVLYTIPEHCRAGGAEVLVTKIAEFVRLFSLRPLTSNSSDACLKHKQTRTTRSGDAIVSSTPHPSFDDKKRATSWIAASLALEAPRLPESAKTVLVLAPTRYARLTNTRSLRLLLLSRFFVSGLASARASGVLVDRRPI